MSDPTDDPHVRAESAPTTGDPAAPLAPPPSAWTSEHYGFAGPPPPPVDHRAAAHDPAREAHPPDVAATVAKPWWNRGRTLAAAGVAAAVFAVGALGFTVGHAAGSGPERGDGTSVVGHGPGGRGFGR